MACILKELYFSFSFSFLNFSRLWLVVCDSWEDQLDHQGIKDFSIPVVY